MITIYVMRKLPAGQEIYLAESEEAKDRFVRKQGVVSINKYELEDGRDVIKFMTLVTDVLDGGAA